MQVPAEVSAAAGEAAVLPCTFTHPHRHYDGPLTAIWRAGEPYAGPQVFRCAAARGSELCQTALSLHGRFHLLGNPRRNDLSLRVERLALADEGRYFCRVEFSGDIHDRYESRHGVRLRVTGELGGVARGCPARRRLSFLPALPPATGWGLLTRGGHCAGRQLRKGIDTHFFLQSGALALGSGYGQPGPLSMMQNPGPGRAGWGLGMGIVVKLLESESSSQSRGEKNQ